MPLLQIQQLQYALPDGCQPFPALGHAFPFRRTGLVGRTVAANRCWGSYWQARSPLMPDTCCAGAASISCRKNSIPTLIPPSRIWREWRKRWRRCGVFATARWMSATTNCFKTIGIANHRFNNCCPTPA